MPYVRLSYTSPNLSEHSSIFTTVCAVCNVQYSAWSSDKWSKGRALAMASSRFLRLYASKHNRMGSNNMILRTLSKKAYTDTLNLPQTLFPLRANAAVRELEIQEVRNCSFARLSI